MRHCTDPTCLIDDCALWDVVMPRTTITPKEYTEKGRHEWAQEMAEIYPDGIDLFEEDPYLMRLVDNFDPFNHNSRTFIAMLKLDMPLVEICKTLGVNQKDVPLYLSRPNQHYTAGQFFLLEELVRSGEPMRISDLVRDTGIKLELVRTLVAAIGARHEWLTPEGARLTYTYEQRDRILEANAQGVPKADIARQFDLPYSTIVSLIRKQP